MEIDIEWNDPQDFPDVVSDAGNGFSIDVFVYCESTNEHTVGWYDYTKNVWNFLCREPIGKRWKWRYLNESIDKWKK